MTVYALFGKVQGKFRVGARVGQSDFAIGKGGLRCGVGVFANRNQTVCLILVAIACTLHHAVLIFGVAVVDIRLVQTFKRVRPRF